MTHLTQLTRLNPPSAPGGGEGREEVGESPTSVLSRRSLCANMVRARKAIAADPHLTQPSPPRGAERASRPRILVGVIGRPHGVRGLVHVTSHTEDPAALAGYGPLTDDRGRRWALIWRGEGIAELRDEAGRPVADRSEAEAFINSKLYADRGRLPPTAEGEFYLADLIGLAAVDGTGASLGTVERVHNYGAGASLEITCEGTSLLVPFTRASVPEVDLAAGRVTVSPPKAVSL